MGKPSDKSNLGFSQKTSAFYGLKQAFEKNQGNLEHLEIRKIGRLTIKYLVLVE